MDISLNDCSELFSSIFCIRHRPYCLLEQWKEMRLNISRSFWARVVINDKADAFSPIWQVERVEKSHMEMVYVQIQGENSLISEGFIWKITQR